MLLLLVSVFSGCAFLQPAPISEHEKKYEEARTLAEAGKFQDAREAFRTIAEAQPEASWGEQAKFNAAYLLVSHKNPDRNYTLAAREFEEYLVRYPIGRFADDAGSWLEVIKGLGMSRTNELLKEVDTLTKKLEDLRQDYQQKISEKEEVTRERDSLSIEKTNLSKKLDDLLFDKDSLLKEKALLLKDKEGLTEEVALGLKKVDALTIERDALIAAKEKLEKSLHDLMALDVKMEKKRKKLK